jgi:DNA ligase-1
MLDKGYKYSIEEALASSGNQLGFLRPMLAQSIKKVTAVNYKQAVLQKKLDGHRCLITKDEGKVIAYSRQGKIIDTITHITDQLQDILEEGETIDGELYCHGQLLQTIASWVKRKQPNTVSLTYAVYDCIDDAPYIERHRYLQDKLKGLYRVVVLPYILYENSEQMQAYLSKVRGQGFEGLMLRLHGYGYESGKRSASLIKVKVFEDTEVNVIGVIPSSEGWAICVAMYNGKQFNISAPGDFSAKYEVMKNKDKYIGRDLTIEYSHLTAEGIPFHAVALRWREDL